MNKIIKPIEKKHIVKNSLEIKNIKNRKVNNSLENKEYLIEEKNYWLQSFPNYQNNDSSWQYIYKLINKNKNYFYLLLAYTLIINSIIFLFNKKEFKEKILINNLKIFIKSNRLINSLLKNKEVDKIAIFLVKVIFPILDIFLFPTLYGFLLLEFIKKIFKRKKIWKWFSFTIFIIINYKKEESLPLKLLSIIGIIPIYIISILTYEKTENIWLSIDIESLNSAIIIVFSFLLRWINLRIKK